MTLTVYLSKVVALRILAAGLVLVVLGLGFDLLSSASDLVAFGGAEAVLRYAWLRLPLIGAIMFPIAVLTGATLAFHSLSARSEMAVARAAGVSVFRVLLWLAPLALVLGVFYNQLSDRIGSWAETALEAAFPPPEDDIAEAGTGAEPIWTRGAREVVRAYPAVPDGTALERLTLYRLSPRGKIVARITAAAATYDGERWTLSGVEFGGGEQVIRVERMAWSTRLTPADIRVLAGGRRTASSASARAVLAGEAAPTRGRAYYATRIASSYAAYAVPAVMLILGAMVAFGSARTGRGVHMAVLAIVLGFLYVAADGFFASMGEVGAFDPRLAAFTPSMFFAIVGVWGLVLLEN